MAQVLVLCDRKDCAQRVHAQTLPFERLPESWATLDSIVRLLRRDEHGRYVYAEQRFAGSA